MSVSSLRFEPISLVEYTSADGPALLGMKAVVIQGRLKYMREQPYYQDYLARLTPEHRTAILEALASSWIHVDAVTAHYRALDALPISETEFERSVEPIGLSIFSTVFSAFMNLTKGTSAEVGTWTVVRNTHRIWGRIFQGTTCKVTQVGPKDALFETSGMTLAELRSFRITLSGFIRTTLQTTARSSSVRELPTGQARSKRYALSLSWV